MTRARERISEIIDDNLYCDEAGNLVEDAVSDAADAILAAMPDIVRGMVKPLEWDKHPDEQEWYAKLPEVEGDKFERGFMILPSRGGFILFDGFNGRSRALGNFTLTGEAQQAANDLHTAQVLKGLGL